MVKKKKTKITIGIPCYNCKDTLEETLQSINIQTFQPYEVILLDDASRDNYEKILEKFNDIKIRHIKLDKNQGVGNARIRIIDECKTKYITMIDSDDVFYSADVLQNFDNYILDEPDLVITNFLMQKPDFSIQKYEKTGIGCHGKIYNVEFMREHNINFCPLKAHEEGFVNRYISSKGKTQRKNIDTYLWRWDTGGITRKQDPIYTFFEDYIESLKRTVERIPNTYPNSIITLYSYWEQMEQRFKKDPLIKKYKEIMINSFSWDYKKLKDFYTKDKKTFNNFVNNAKMYGLQQKKNIFSFMKENNLIKEQKKIIKKTKLPTIDWK